MIQVDIPPAQACPLAIAARGFCCPKLTENRTVSRIKVMGLLWDWRPAANFQIRVVTEVRITGTTGNDRPAIQIETAAVSQRLACATLNEEIDREQRLQEQRWDEHAFICFFRHNDLRPECYIPTCTQSE